MWELRLEALESEPQAFRETASEHRQRSLAKYAEQLRAGENDGVVFGALHGTDLVGMAGFYRKQPEQGCIWGMYVSPSWRKSGVGAELIHAIIAHARTLEAVRSLHLTVARSQTAARNLYLRCGFEVSDDKPTTACGSNLPEDQENMVLRLFQDR